MLRTKTLVAGPHLTSVGVSAAEEAAPTTTLPCGHAFCTECVAELRKKGVSDVCPLCRAPLPPGREKLFELALRVWRKIMRAVDPQIRGPWPPLSSSQQKEMNGAIVMAQEAMDQVSGAVDWCHS